jgi:glycoside/pentoside/hexuronide:cation symporter, GPH family
LTAIVQGELAPLAPSDPVESVPLPSRGERLPIRTKVVYGTGSFVDVLVNAVLSNFNLFYLTIVCGLSGTLAGAAAFIALAVDAFVDPFVGSVSDNTQSRWGRRHPFMIVAALPVALAFGLMFSVPKGLSDWPLFAYAIGVALFLRFGLSTYVIPYTAMGSELTDDYHERSVVVAYRHFFGIIATILPLALGIPLFLKGHAKYLHDSYLAYAWTCAAIVLAGALVCAFGTLNDRARLHRAHHTAQYSLAGQFREIGEVFRNRSFCILFACLVIFFVAQGTAGVLALHANAFFWKLPDAIIATASIAIPVGSAIGIPIITWLARTYEKRTIVLGGQFAFCLIQGVPPLLRIGNILPPNGPLLYGVLIADALVAGVIITALVIGFQSMLADAADEHDLLFNARREGLYFAGLSFSVKAAAGAGVFLAGIALDAIGFPTGTTAHAGAIAAVTVRNLGLIYGPGPALLTSICILVTWHYRIDRRAHGEIQRKLAERNAAASL